MTLRLLLNCSKSVNHPRNQLRFLSVPRRFRTVSVADSIYHKRLEMQLSDVNASSDALKMYEKMTSTKPLPNIVQFNKLLSRLVKLKEYPTAISPFKDICSSEIPRNHCVPDQFTYTPLLKGLFEENRVSEALEVFKRMVRRKLCEIDIVAYGVLIDALCKTDDDKDEISMFIDLVKSSRPNLTVFNSLLQELFSRGRSVVALRIYHETDCRNKANFLTYCHLLHGLCQNGRVEQAWRYLQDKPLSVPTSYEQDIYIECLPVPLPVEYYNIIMDGFCEAKRLRGALDIFNKRWPNLDAVSYGTIIKGYVDNGLLEEAKDTFRRMKSRRLLPKSATYSILIRGSLMRGKDDDASNFLEEMVGERRFFPDSSTQGLLLDFMGDEENYNTRLVKVIQKFLAPTALARRKTALACQSDSEVGSNDSLKLHEPEQHS